MLNLNESCACGWTLDKEISGWFTLLGNHQGLLFAQSRRDTQRSVKGTHGTLYSAM